MKGKCRKILFTAALFLTLLFGMSVTSHAAAKLYTLTPGKTYRCFDINKNGGKDSFKYVNSSSSSGFGYSHSIYVNGSRVYYSSDVPRPCTIYVYYVGGKAYPVLEYRYQGGASDYIALNFSAGKYTGSTLLDGVRYYFGKIGVTGNYLRIISQEKNNTSQTFSKIYFSAANYYKISGGKIVPYRKPGTAIRYWISDSGTSKLTFTAQTSFYLSKTYSTLGQNNGAYVSRGQKVTVKYIYFKDRGYNQGFDRCYYVYTNGKWGWFCDSAGKRLA